jgi:hypothetical protein
MVSKQSLQPKLDMSYTFYQMCGFLLACDASALGILLFAVCKHGWMLSCCVGRSFVAAC